MKTTKQEIGGVSKKADKHFIDCDRYKSLSDEGYTAFQKLSNGMEEYVIIPKDSFFMEMENHSFYVLKKRLKLK